RPRPRRHPLPDRLAGVQPRRLEAPLRRAVAAAAAHQAPLRPGRHPHARPGDLLMAIPGPPWHSEVDALLWLHRALPAARAALPPQLAARAGLPITMGGLISYRT